MQLGARAEYKQEAFLLALFVCIYEILVFEFVHIANVSSCLEYDAIKTEGGSVSNVSRASDEHCWESNFQCSFVDLLLNTGVSDHVTVMLLSQWCLPLLLETLPCHVESEARPPHHRVMLPIYIQLQH